MSREGTMTASPKKEGENAPPMQNEVPDTPVDAGAMAVEDLGTPTPAKSALYRQVPTSTNHPSKERTKNKNTGARQHVQCRLGSHVTALASSCHHSIPTTLHQHARTRTHIQPHAGTHVHPHHRASHPSLARAHALATLDRPEVDAGSGWKVNPLEGEGAGLALFISVVVDQEEEEG